MHRYLLLNISIVTVAVIVLGCAARDDESQATALNDPQQAGRLAALRAGGVKTSLALCPVQIQGQPNRAVADVLGLVLESHGMEKVDALDAQFAPPADAAWEQLATPLGEFVRKNPPASDYVLYAQYLGEPATGPTEVRFVIVDKAGALVLSDRQTKADADFQRVTLRKPDPMGCSVLVAERLFTQLGWKKSTGPGPRDGKFAKLWAQKSGLPDDAERTAMKQRLEKLKAGLKTARVCVFPTLVGTQANADSAARLAQLVGKQTGAKATAEAVPVTIAIEPTSNQQKRLWDLARAFRAHLRSNPIESDYALLAEFLLPGAGGPAHSVNFVLCDKSGDWVIVDFQNNQSAAFQRLSPKTVADCERLAAERLASLTE